MAVNGFPLPSFAWMVDVVEVETPVVRMANVAELEPLATRTVVGTDATLLEEPRVTVRPPEGATPVRVTVPELELPPMTLFGETVSPDSLGAWMLRLAVVVLAPAVAVIVAVSSAATALVPIAKVAELAPEAIVTDVGIFASATVELSETTAPVLPAAWEIVMVPEAELPPMSEAGVIVKLEIWNGLTVN